MKICIREYVYCLDSVRKCRPSDKSGLILSVGVNIVTEHSKVPCQENRSFHRAFQMPLRHQLFTTCCFSLMRLRKMVSSVKILFMLADKFLVY